MASLAEVPVPAAAGEALVRVALSGICNTDLELVKGYAGFEGTLGHEFVGVVEDAGGGPIARGERVVGEINAGCGACPRCASGDPRHCAHRTVLGIVGRDGAHADYLRLPARNLLRVPALVRDTQAVFAEPLAAACGVLERCPEAAAGKVAVLGDGKLGLLCARVLAAHGGRPLLVGKHPQKRARAAQSGIETSDLAAARRRGRAFDVVVEASGSPSGFALALELLVPLGTLVLKSTYHGVTPFDSAKVVVEELKVVGSRCGRFAPALELLASGAVQVEDLISDTVPLSRAEQALEEAATPGALKVLLQAG